MTSQNATEQVEPAAEATRPRRRWQRVVAIAIWAYLALIVVLWIWMRSRGDRGPWATIFLFGPRWLCMTPLAVLVPLAAVWQRRLWWVLVVALAIALVPVCGLRLNLPRPNAPYRLRIVTCNVDQQSYDAGALAELVRALDPDVVALQECKRYPPEHVWPAGWQVARIDDLLVASRHPVERVAFAPRPTIPAKPAVGLFRVELPRGELQLFNLHLVTPRSGLEAVLDSRRGIDLTGLPALEKILKLRDEESQVLSRWVLEHPGPKIVVGDFNTPVESLVFRRDWSGLTDAFNAAGLGFGFTKVTETPVGTFGTRIDHVLYSPHWECVRAWVGPDIGSDHLPLVVDLR